MGWPLGAVCGWVRLAIKRFQRRFQATHRVRVLCLPAVVGVTCSGQLSKHCATACRCARASDTPRIICSTRTCAPWSEEAQDSGARRLMTPRKRLVRLQQRAKPTKLMAWKRTRRMNKRMASSTTGRESQMTRGRLGALAYSADASFTIITTPKRMRLRSKRKKAWCPWFAHQPRPLLDHGRSALNRLMLSRWTRAPIRPRPVGGDGTAMEVSWQRRGSCSWSRHICACPTRSRTSC